jgi:hypothetical protein
VPTKSRKKASKTAKPDAKTDAKADSSLQNKRRNLKEELDRIYYTLPYDEVQPILNELKDTVECLTEMADTHTWQKNHGELAGHRNRRRAA